MKEKLEFRCQLFFCMLLICRGQYEITSIRDAPFLMDEEQDTVPVNKFDEVPQSTGTLMESERDLLLPLAGLMQKSFPNSHITNCEDARYIHELSPPDAYQQRLSRKKRSSHENKDDLQEINSGPLKYVQHMTPTLSRDANSKANGKTLQWSSSFMPRFSPIQFYNPSESIYVKTKNLPNQDSENQSKEKNLSLGKFLNPILKNMKNDLQSRIIKSEGSSRINLNTGNPFTPRLGRSKQLSILDSVFQQKIGRSEGPKQILLGAGSHFTPRLGRPGNKNRILFNSDTPFTPRLGRSDTPSGITLGSRSPFTPRLGRSGGSTRILVNSETPFTPRLGRSESSHRIMLNNGSLFTPRLGRLDSSNRILLNSETPFIPRLGRSESSNRILLSNGSSFTPRLGRANNLN